LFRPTIDSQSLQILESPAGDGVIPLRACIAMAQLRARALGLILLLAAGAACAMPLATRVTGELNFLPNPATCPGLGPLGGAASGRPPASVLSHRKHSRQPPGQAVRRGESR
jgi:hypothetical protein